MGMNNFFDHISNILPENEVQKLVESCNLPIRKSIRFLSYSKKDKKIAGYNGDTYILEEKIYWTEDGFYVDKNSRPSKSLDYLRGDFYIQEAAAMYPVSFLSNYIKNNDNNYYKSCFENKEFPTYILDYSSSPGGKTLQLADYFPYSIILANEIIKGRVFPLYTNIIRAKLKNIILLNQPFEFFEKSNFKFNIILADLPCSGQTLIFKKKLDIKSYKFNEIKFNSKRQKKISSLLIKLLRENALFLYSTCTFSKEENEDIVEFLMNNNLELIHQKRLWPHIDNCAGGFSSLLKNNGNSTNFDKFEYIENQTEKLLKLLEKNPFFDLNKIKNSGFLYQKENKIFLFSFPKLLKYFFDNAILIGQPIAIIEKYGIVPLWNSIDYVKDDLTIEIEPNLLLKLLRGEDLQRLSAKKDSDYFVIRDKESGLFLVKLAENGVKNLIPEFLMIK